MTKIAGSGSISQTMDLLIQTQMPWIWNTVLQRWDIVTIVTEGSMQGNTVARQQSTRVQTPLF
jgi:hypothetical protein